MNEEQKTNRQMLEKVLQNMAKTRSTGLEKGGKGGKGGDGKKGKKGKKGKNK